MDVIWEISIRGSGRKLKGAVGFVDIAPLDRLKEMGWKYNKKMSMEQEPGVLCFLEKHVYIFEKLEDEFPAETQFRNGMK